MKTNAAGRDLIKRWEGLSLKAYPDPATGGKPWTIGYGHTGDVEPHHVITEHQAEVILDVDIDRAEGIVTRAVRVLLNENQFSALVSFVFNVGPGRKDLKDGFVALKSGQPSAMLRKLNAGDFSRYDSKGVLVGGAAAEFLKWKYAAGKVLPGLVKRRAAERALFLTPVK